MNTPTELYALKRPLSGSPKSIAEPLINFFNFSSGRFTEPKWLKAFSRGIISNLVI